MKTKFLLTSLFALILLNSCSSSSDDSGVDNSPATTFLPLTNGNYWVYNVDNAGTINRDSLYISNDTIINAVTYKKMKTLATPTGFFSTTLRNNGVKIDASKLQMTGNFTVNFGLSAPIELALTDFIFFKENATTNDVLSTTSGTLNQTVSGYPLTIDYTLKTVADGSLATFLSDGTTYTDVKKTKVILNLKITTTQTISGITVPITIMNPQDVVTSTQYYSKNIGMVYANTLINYQLNSIPGVTLPIPSSGTQTQEEFLAVYHIN
ncbi:hypothetical protein OX283_010650 [Flavobacterium sp. SUN052]|uniref:hypothetical protein n=1 Tax=Flavobacterium sp. SUN052 TaxID=3002441 RepID=UPI00237E04AC|nr:hypothetical protein [Flavobacterium sp. SUN052]MEC4005119.1 hypothetical protein [Flavobacterium sp. SUN052]